METVVSADTSAPVYVRIYQDGEVPVMRIDTANEDGEIPVVRIDTTNEGGEVVSIDTANEDGEDPVVKPSDAMETNVQDASRMKTRAESHCNSADFESEEDPVITQSDTMETRPVSDACQSIDSLTPECESAGLGALRVGGSEDVSEGGTRGTSSALISTEGVGVLVDQPDAGEITIASPTPMECPATDTTCGSMELPSECGLGGQYVGAEVSMTLVSSNHGDRVDAREKESLAGEKEGEEPGICVQEGGGDTAQTITAIQKAEVDLNKATLLKDGGLQVEVAEQQSLRGPGKLVEVREDDQLGGKMEADGLGEPLGGGKTEADGLGEPLGRKTEADGLGEQLGGKMEADGLGGGKTEVDGLGEHRGGKTEADGLGEQLGGKTEADNLGEQRGRTMETDGLGEQLEGCDGVGVQWGGEQEGEGLCGGMTKSEAAACQDGAPVQTEVTSQIETTSQNEMAADTVSGWLSSAEAAAKTCEELAGDASMNLKMDVAADTERVEPVTTKSGPDRTSHDETCSLSSTSSVVAQTSHGSHVEPQPHTLATVSVIPTSSDPDSSTALPQLSHASHMTLEATPPPKQPTTGDFISLDHPSAKGGDLEHERPKERRNTKKKPSKDRLNSPAGGQSPFTFGQLTSTKQINPSSHMTTKMMSDDSHMRSEQIQMEILQIDSVLKSLNMGVFDASNVATIDALTSEETKPQVRASVGLQLISQMESADSSSSVDSSSDSSDDSMGVQRELRQCDGGGSEGEEEKGERSDRRPMIKGEVDYRALPPVEDCNIPFPEGGHLVPIGKVIHHTESLVILESFSGPRSPVDEGTVLWSEDQRSLAKVFETFGPVKKPYYSIRVNSPDHVTTLGLTPNTVLYVVAGNLEMTRYVFTERLMNQRGSDASWKDDSEIPAEFQEFSDDEAEAKSRDQKHGGRKRKQKASNHPHVPHGNQHRCSTSHVQPNSRPFFERPPRPHRFPSMIPPVVPQQGHYPTLPPYPIMGQLPPGGFPPALPYYQQPYGPPLQAPATYYFPPPRADVFPRGVPPLMMLPPHPHPHPHPPTDHTTHLPPFP